MDKGMKIGMLIAMAIVVAAGVFLLWGLREPPDPPTARTAPDKLKVVDLPANLPVIWEPIKPDLNAAPFYEKANTYVVANYPDSKKTPSDKILRDVSEMLIEGMEAGKVEKGLLDEMVPFKPQPTPPQLAAVPMVAVLGTKQAVASGKRGEYDRAYKELLAVWVYGERLVRYSQRFHCRFDGMRALQLAFGELTRDDNILSKIPEGEKKLLEWEKAMGPVWKAWNDKRDMILTVKPPPGDLINLARREEDPAIRIEAIRHLGVLKFLTKKKGNLQSIDDVLLAAKADPNPLFVQAANAADAMTKQDFQKLGK